MLQFSNQVACQEHDRHQPDDEMKVKVCNHQFRSHKIDAVGYTIQSKVTRLIILTHLHIFNMEKKEERNQ